MFACDSLPDLQLVGINEELYTIRQQLDELLQDNLRLRARERVLRRALEAAHVTLSDLSAAGTAAAAGGGARCGGGAAREGAQRSAPSAAAAGGGGSLAPILDSSSGGSSGGDAVLDAVLQRVRELGSAVVVGVPDDVLRPFANKTKEFVDAMRVSGRCCVMYGGVLLQQNGFVCMRAHV